MLSLMHKKRFLKESTSESSSDLENLSKKKIDESSKIMQRLEGYTFGDEIDHKLWPNVLLGPKIDHQIEAKIE